MPSDPIAKALAKFPVSQREALAETRARISAALPGAHEEIAWGMPAFLIGDDNVLCYSGFSDHNSLFPGSHVQEVLVKDLAGFPTTKGTIHFDMDSAFPVALLQKILKVRIAEINASYPKRGGQVREYYDNGHPKILGKMKDEKPDGAWEWFHKDGTHMRTGAYRAGKKTGEWTTFATDGSVTKVSTYK
ncbi:MAG: DUF1801 domain-containing protein [Actinomycetota bacterium]